MSVIKDKLNWSLMHWRKKTGVSQELDMALALTSMSYVTWGKLYGLLGIKSFSLSIFFLNIHLNIIKWAMSSLPISLRNE